MVQGLGLAETTPGPLIMVTQFVGFVAAYGRAPGLTPLTAGVLGGLLTTWCTFLPCFLFVLLGAPFVERLAENPNISAAFGGITCAVVGAIANLSIYTTWHTIWPTGNDPDDAGVRHDAVRRASRCVAVSDPQRLIERLASMMEETNGPIKRYRIETFWNALTRNG
ncbi:MAG: chromate transporter [Chloroflexi bacterium]|nr:chromate transporter [Chloroflexota bacterium]